MVTFNEVQAQLMSINKRSRTLNVQEVKQIASILEENEQIMACLKGWHKGSVALLCATDKRVLLLDNGNMQAPLQVIEYHNVVRLQQSTTGWMCNFAVVSKDQKHEFKVWGMKRARDLHQFMHRHILYLQKLSLENALLADVPKITAKPAYTGKSWRALMRKMGNAATL